MNNLSFLSLNISNTQITSIKTILDGIAGKEYLKEIMIGAKYIFLIKV